MHSANPMVHLRHAWDATRSVWGKVAIVLLYVFIWSSIISAGVAFIWPGSQGMHCLLGVITDDWTRQFAITMYRSSSLWAIGFFLYADMGGIRVSNVAMVTVFTTILTVTGYLAMTNGAGPPPPPDDAACVADTNAGLLAGVIVGLVWIWITLFCSIMEKKWKYRDGGRDDPYDVMVTMRRSVHCSGNSERRQRVTVEECRVRNTAKGS